jgi:transposase InsO family protein
LIEGRSWPTLTVLRSATFAWIESWYNLHPRHSSLGAISPARYEEQKHHQPAASQAA